MLVSSNIMKYLHTTLAGVMAVWLSGVVFLFCCHTASAAPVDSCPMAKMSAHCDKGMKQNNASHVVTPSAVDCIQCGFLPVVFDKSRKVDQVHKQLTPAIARIAVHFDPLVFAVPAAKAPPLYARVPVRERIFIKNCVFRI
ncbi:MAG TPA: hypothetical protein VHQ01_01345 [Pyrinomonadaceae bacterium]|nr:hypothetical protein [Pyrinomonadaceae bacterium]